MRFTRIMTGACLCGMLTAITAVVAPDVVAQDKAGNADGKALFEQKCLKCHKPEKFNSQHNDRKGWELILSRMERNSCVLSEKEQSVLADYLSKEHGE